MAKGKYKTRSRLANAARADADAATQAAKLAHERELLRESEQAAADIDALVAEIRVLEAEHAARHRTDEERLRAEIEFLLAEVAETSARAHAARRRREKLMPGGMGRVVLENVVREVERRLAERYPDQPDQPDQAIPDDLVIIEGDHQRGLPLEIVRTIQRAQRKR